MSHPFAPTLGSIHNLDSAVLKRAWSFRPRMEAVIAGDGGYIEYFYF